MELDKIVVKGAREHNLKSVYLEIPKRQLVVFTGPERWSSKVNVEPCRTR
jgi:excinuclease UvrABC ATPase subunit